MFAEGNTVIGDTLYQLTWKKGIATAHSLDNLKVKATFRYPGEGWGLTTDGTSLYKSNGSAEIQQLNPLDFSVQRRIPVSHQGKPLSQLNELEWAAGLILANVWLQNTVVAIDPETGEVLASYDFSNLVPDRRQYPHADVLNGIAFDAATSDLYITGKRWPYLYRYRFDPAEIMGNK